MIDAMAVGEGLGQAAQTIISAKRILAVAHVNPDGDAIGSLAAFGSVAQALGTDVRLFCESPIPDYLCWLPLPVTLLADIADLGAWRPDLVVFLDCADRSRAGESLTNFLASTNMPCRTLCIDHHIANPLFADVNWVEPSMSATGAMVALLAEHLGQKLEGALGEAIYLALVSDTGSFSYGNTDGLTLQIAAKIVQNGLSVASFTSKFENNWTIARMHLWGDLMRKIQLECSGQVAISIVSEENLRRRGAGSADLEGYSSWLRRLAGTKVGMLVRPSGTGSKASLRSMGDFDVQAIAAIFGGGGHVSAAGVEMCESPQRAAELLLAEIRKKL